MHCHYKNKHSLPNTLGAYHPMDLSWLPIPEHVQTHMSPTVKQTKPTTTGLNPISKQSDQLTLIMQQFPEDHLRLKQLLSKQERVQASLDAIENEYCELFKQIQDNQEVILKYIGINSNILNPLK